jgi:3-phenylpropionate/trans-cinnamate dioxygenase ferredoxin reductase subunit
MVIVGAGQCGVRTAAALRENGWEGEITLLGNEGSAPYDRPPLSKAVLLGERSTAQCAFYDDAFYRDQRIDLRVDACVQQIDRGARKVVLRDARTIDYQRLLIATGAEPRRLDVPGANLDGVYLLRTASDANALAEVLQPARRIAIVGAGFIGLEVAASAVARGCEVVVIEAGARALMRAVPEVVAGYLIDRHRQMGVKIHFAAQIDRLLGSTRVTGVKLKDGTQIDCDCVVVGISVKPRTELAEAAGIDVADGIAVDDTLRTNDPHIFAAGDVCSWKNAEDHARIVARNMLERGETYSEVPWFWSNQYDMTIQIAGLPAFGVESVVRETGDTSRIFFALDRDGVLVGASGVGKVSEIARDVRVAQTLIGQRACIEPALLEDRSIKLKGLVAAEAL